MKFLKNIIFFVIVVAILVVYQFDKWSTESGPLNESTLIYIPKGSGSRKVAEILKEKEVINSPFVFRVLARFKGLDKELKAGEYQFEPKVSMIDAMRKIANFEIYYHRLTLPEGNTTKQFIDIIDTHPALVGHISINVKEGQMLPETYTFERGTDKDKIIAQAMESMDKTLRDAWADRVPNLPVKNIKEMLILASIIEKETAVSSERGLVASVFVNRLIKGMKLQTDPTVIYAITKGQSDLGRALLRKDLSIDDAYNTYKYYGLPPGPICNPGRDSIYAAVNPEVSSYLYFVANGKGGHNFSTSYRDHTNHVNSYRSGRR